MMKLIFLLMLLLTISCGGSEGQASAAAQPGLEVPTQTTTEIMQVPEAAAQEAAAVATPQPAR